jgi:hypothetical protein
MLGQVNPGLVQGRVYRKNNGKLQYPNESDEKKFRKARKNILVGEETCRVYRKTRTG